MSRPMDDVDSKTLAVMLAHCPEHSCDGCSGVEYHCTGRIDMNYVAAKRLAALRMAGDKLAEAVDIVLRQCTPENVDAMDAALAAWKASKP